MTEGRIEQIVRNATHLLLDFDGPVCAIFSGTPNHVIADQLRAELMTEGIAIPAEAEHLGDPLELFRIMAHVSERAAETAQRVLTSLETRAAHTARPTDGATQLIATAYATDRTVTIVSNNSGAAIAAYLGEHNLIRKVTAIVARDDPDPAHMKPSPYLVLEALRQLNAKPSNSVFVGDSPSDVTAGHQANIAVIGFANKPGKDRRLTIAGAEAVTSQLSDISRALRETA